MTTPFTTYAFPASGEPTNRTLPDRLSDYKDVKDWGAVGNNIADDWLAITNAIEWNSVTLLAAANSPAISLTAVRATLTATVGGGQVTALTIGNIGDNYVPGQVYTVTISGGGGTGATATATATAGGLINQASLAITAPGSGYATPPTCTIEYPGHITTLTFTTMINLVNLLYNGGIVDVAHDGTISPGCLLLSVNIGAKTATIRALQEFGTDTAVVRGTAGVVSGVTQIKFLKSNAGPIFFPPGTYRVSRPIDWTGNGTLNAYLFGAGALSKIIGNFNDYVLLRGIDNTSSASGILDMIEKLSVENEHATGGGIRFGMVGGGMLRDIYVTANRGISTYNQDRQNTGVWGSFELVIENIRATSGSGRRSGSFGLAIESDGVIKNCVFYDLSHGVIGAGGQGGLEIQGGRIELCDVGWQAGLMPDGSSFPLSTWSVLGTYFKNNLTAILNLGQGSSLHGVVIEAAPNSAPGGVNANYGIRATGTASQRCFVGGVVIKGTYAVAGFDISGPDSSRANTFLTGVNCINDIANGTTIFSWKMPATAATGMFVENNSPAPVYTFANLPANTSGSFGPNRREGDEFNISNNNGVAWGVAAAAGGSTHALVRVNQALAYVVEGI